MIAEMAMAARQVTSELVVAGREAAHGSPWPSSRRELTVDRRLKDAGQAVEMGSSNEVGQGIRDG